MSKDRGFTDRDLAEVSDSPEWTDEEFARAVPFATAFPDLAANLAQGVAIVRGDAEPLAVRLGGDLAAYYRSFGGDSEARLNADLRRLAGLADPA